MRKVQFLLFLVPGILLAENSRPPEAQEGARPVNRAVSGRWVVRAEFYGTPINFSLELKQEGDRLTGNFDGDKLEGSVSGNAIHFLAKDERSGTEECNGTVQGDTISGTVAFANAEDPGPPSTHQFTANLVPQRRSGLPQRHEFTPTTFYRQFSAANKPVLTISPGDTTHTTTVDAGGKDEKGVTRVLGGNPETGPFYVETAALGDTLVVHFTRVHLNRD